MKLSVIMPTYNRKERCALALNRLLGQTLPEKDYEVLVVDDGSTDGTQEYLESLAPHPHLAYLRHSHSGRAATRNLGLRSARGELILFLDDDVLAAPELLEKHCQAHEAGGDPKRVVLGYTPFHRDIDRTPIVRYYEAYWRSVYRKAANDTLRREPQWFFITNNLSVRRDFVFEAGLFDEEFRLYGSEDFDLGCRLLARGMELVFHPEAVAHHRFEIDLDQSVRQRFECGWSASIFYRKHPEAKAILAIDNATGGFDHPIGLVRRAFRAVKPLFYNDPIMALLRDGIAAFGGILPTPIAFHLITILHWHHYLAGIRQGLSEHGKSVPPPIGKEPFGKTR